MNLKYLYGRYNEYIRPGETINSVNTVIRIIKDGVTDKSDIEKKIKEYDFECFKGTIDKSSMLLLDSKIPQPKSIFCGMSILKTVLNSLPDEYWEKIGIKRNQFFSITLSIVLHYICLNAYVFAERPMTMSQKKNLISNEKFVFSIQDLKKVFWKIDEEDYCNYISCFAIDINSVIEAEGKGLFINGEDTFIICLDEFIYYLIYELEDSYKRNCSKQEFSLYTRNKGFTFEGLIGSLLKELYSDVYSNVLYYPPNKKVELDIVAIDKERLLITECKSGTIRFDDLNDDKGVETRLNNKMAKAYKSLTAVGKYIDANHKYEFHAKNTIINGECEALFLLNVQMFSADFISSNVHTMFPEYIADSPYPIITISFEHLLGIVIDTIMNKRDLLEYFENRANLIKMYPRIQLDNNELDLYYEITRKDSMLWQIINSGMIDNMPQGRIVSSFHNELGEETRPSMRMIKQIEQLFFSDVFANGKRNYHLNRRYLINLEEYLRMW